MNNLKIKKYHTYPVKVPLRIKPKASTGEIPYGNFVVLKIDTNSDISGNSYVFTFREDMLKPTADLINSVCEGIIDEVIHPNTQIEKLRNRYTLLDKFGLLGQAFAGIDMALWDIFSKKLNLPLCRALGYELQPLKTYNSCGLWIQDTNNLAKEAEELVENGNFKAIKLRLGRENFRDDIKAVESVLNVIDENTELMVDFNQSLNVNEGIKRCIELDNYNLTWIEEPIKHDNYLGCANISAQIATPIQIGENFLNVFEMKKSIDALSSNFVMPDVQRIGGVSGWLKASILAEASDLDISSHLFPEISSHLLCASPTKHWLEYVDWANPILRNPIKVQNGFYTANNVPGNGIDIDYQSLNDYLI